MVVTALGELVERLSIGEQRPRLDLDVLLRLYDTLGVGIAAAGSVTGRALRDSVLRTTSPSSGCVSELQLSTVQAAVLGACVRMSECDDILLPVSITPGAIVVPMALLGAAVDGACTSNRLGDAIAAGYELALRLGSAIDGARRVYEGVWPSYQVAPVVASVVSGLAMGLSVAQLQHAASLALCAGAGAPKIASKGDKWLPFALALARGAAAAMAAREGQQGDHHRAEVIEAELGFGDLSNKDRGVGEPEVSAVGMTSMKPYCCGRQSLGAIEFFRSVLALGVDPDDIISIDVRVPEQYAAMIVRPLPPTRPQESRGVAYQLAIAAFHPEDLFDFERRTFHVDTETLGLARRVEVAVTSKLTRLYPRHWGAEIAVQSRHGWFEMGSPIVPGDPEAPLTWDQVRSKVHRLVRLMPPAVTDSLARMESAVEELAKGSGPAPVPSELHALVTATDPGYSAESQHVATSTRP